MSGLDIMVGAILIVAVVLVTLILFGTRGRGRLIECPECGAQFKRPAFGEKSVGMGPGLPGIRDFTCPQCKHRANTTSFRYVDVDKQSNPSGK